MPPPLVALSVVLPLFTGVLLTLLVSHTRWQQPIALTSAGLSLIYAAISVVSTASGAIFVLPIGGWGPRAGIVWVTDGLSAAMLLATAIVSISALIYAPDSLPNAPERKFFYSLQQFLMVGVNGSLVTGDLFHLFVFFEIMLLASFALIALGSDRTQFVRIAPYVATNLILSAVFLAGVGLIYGSSGAVNMAELSVRISAGGLPKTFWAAGALVIVVLMVKSALFPLFNWLPDSYPESPIVVNGLFAGLLTKVGVYTLFRLIPLVGASMLAPIRDALLVISALTMLIGVLGALGRHTIRGILSFHIVSQVGYMVFGLVLMTPIAMAAGFFHLIHNMLAKTALIFAGGIAERWAGSGTLGVERGLARTHPWVAAAFFVPAMSLAGMPPFSGFWGKWFLVIGGIDAHAFATTAISLLVGLFTLASMLKIWNAVFWGKPKENPRNEGPIHGCMFGSTLGLGALTVFMGLCVAPIFTHLERVASQILAVTPYVNAVLGPVSVPFPGESP